MGQINTHKDTENNGTKTVLYLIMNVRTEKITYSKKIARQKLPQRKLLTAKCPYGELSLFLSDLTAESTRAKIRYCEASRNVPRRKIIRPKVWSRSRTPPVTFRWLHIV